MKLYAWQPKGHGEYSFFVMAESKKEAIEEVEKYIEKELELNLNSKCGLAYEIGGWGTDYYDLTVLDPLQVIINDNG